MVWHLQCILPQDPSTHSESSWKDRWCLSPLPPGHLQHPSHPQSPLHCRWSHPPDTQLLQSAAIREETAESPDEDQQTEGQLHSSGCQEAQLPPPPPLFYPTHHWTLTLRPPPSSPHPQDLTPPPPPPHLQTVTRTSHFVQHWTDHYLSSIDCKLPLSDSLIKDCSLSSYHFNRLISSFALHIISAQFCLFNWFALYLPCALCHFIYLFFFYNVLICISV